MSKPLAARLRKYSYKVVAEIMPTYYVGVLFAEGVLSEGEREELEDMKTTRLKQAKRCGHYAPQAGEWYREILPNHQGS